MLDPHIIETIVHDLGLSALPKEEREQFLSDVGEVLFSAVMDRVWHSLPDEHRDTFTDILKRLGGDSTPDEREYEALKEFLDMYVPQFDTYVQEEAERIKKRQRQIYTDIT